MDRIIEPYLIYIDDFMYEYLHTKMKKENFLKIKDLCLENYVKELKNLNRDKIDWSIFLTNYSINKPKIMLNIIKDSMKEEKLFYKFNYLFNSYYYFTYKDLNEIYFETLEILILKNSLGNLKIDRSYKPAESDYSIILRFPNQDESMMKLDLIRRKAKISKILISMVKLKKYSSIICYLYRDYVMYCSIKILEKYYPVCQNSNNNLYIKIGYYLMNLKCFFTENKFSKEEFYNDFFK